MIRKHRLSPTLSAVFLAGLLVLPVRLWSQAPEGITVHGDWVIEVLNADGSLAHRHAFRNALDLFGKRDLAAFLSRTNPVALWRVLARGTDGLCLPSADYCQIAESGDNLTSGGISASKNLTVTGADVEVVLHGSFVAATSGSVSSVMTVNMRNDTAAGAFTQTTLSSPIPVEATQTVSVTVTFSFQ